MAMRAQAEPGGGDTGFDTGSNLKKRRGRKKNAIAFADHSKSDKGEGYGCAEKA